MPTRLKPFPRIRALCVEEFIQPLNIVWVATSSGKLFTPMFSPASV
jgi:hypothetical protein